ncbi:MAG: hypothetical protein IT441_09960 [Phycisphaeraceae bacterium]|nr:hypothetical protein [Phycisphaeraceae bacterium]
MTTQTLTPAGSPTDAKAPSLSDRLLATALVLGTSLVGMVVSLRLGVMSQEQALQSHGYAALLAGRAGWLFGGRLMFWIAGAFAVGAICAVASVMRTSGRSGAARLGLAAASFVAFLCVWWLVLAAIGVLRPDRWLLAVAGSSWIGVQGWVFALRLARASAPDRGPRGAPGAIGVPLLAGLMLAMGVVAVQSGAAPTPVARSLATKLLSLSEFDTGVGPERWIRPHGGEVPLAVERMPLIGRPDAARIVVQFIDYTDLESRQVYELLTKMRRRYGDQLAILPVLFPIDPAVNPRISLAAAPDGRSGELARLALAVWLADPSQFAGFHEWLMSPDDPHRSPSLDEARARARQLVGNERLDAAMADPRLDQTLDVHVRAKPSNREKTAPDGRQVDLLTTLMWGGVNGKPGHVIPGVFPSNDDFLSIFEESTGLKPLPQATDSSLFDALTR